DQRHPGRDQRPVPGEHPRPDRQGTLRGGSRPERHLPDRRQPARRNGPDPDGPTTRERRQRGRQGPFGNVPNPSRADSMRILLTGGAAYIGSACLPWLIRHGHEPIAYDNLSEGNAAAVPGERLVRGDIADVERMVEVMRQHRTEAVMHFAALASVP